LVYRPLDDGASSVEHHVAVVELEAVGFAIGALVGLVALDLFHQVDHHEGLRFGSRAGQVAHEVGVEDPPAGDVLHVADFHCSRDGGFQGRFGEYDQVELENRVQWWVTGTSLITSTFRDFNSWMYCKEFWVTLSSAVKLLFCKGWYSTTAMFAVSVSHGEP
jgi:hypothetical protein